MPNVCPECGEYTICSTCQNLFDEEAYVLALEEDIEKQAMAELIAIANMDARVNIGSGEDVCLA